MEIILSGLWEIISCVLVEGGLQAFLYGLGRLCLHPFSHQEHEEFIYVLTGLCLFIAIVLGLFYLETLYVEPTMMTL